MFSHLRASKHADSIYYADLFRINGKVWAITGAGKSDAGRAASGNRREDDLARDSVAFIRQGSTLVSRFDPGAISTDSGSTLHTLHQLAAVVYCLSECESTKMFKVKGKPLDLVEINAAALGCLLMDKPYPAPLAPHFFDDVQLQRLYDPIRRLSHWNALTEGVTGVRWLLAPWMPSAAQKGALYASFVL